MPDARPVCIEGDDVPSRVTAQYHETPEGWWGEVVGWNITAIEPTLDQLRRTMETLIPFGVDERLGCRSVMFVHWKHAPGVYMDHDAKETFQLTATASGQEEACDERA